ncbi:hypothetical protein [Paenibacillus sp. NRS-1760]|uniref:hypothetical protein n=1 Tax=Paenibacillus sp. NRS-1760 TaxID=3233902 RepID=UPI003D2D0EBA
MLVLKDDKVRLTCGTRGTVGDMWGRARHFMLFKPDDGKKPFPMDASNVAEILQRGPLKWGGRIKE